MTAVYQTNIQGAKLLNRGKVRDIYDFGDKLLLVTSDRISAYDVVMDQPIGDKGKILTQISLFWFDQMKDLIDNQIISADVNDFPEACHPYKDVLKDRSILVKKATPLLIECVVRGYISGSGWNSYQENGTVCGISLPKGLKESEKLPEPLFTPSTKAEQGLHDENISFEEAQKIVGSELAEKVRQLSLEIYKRGAEIAKEKGIIIADTKFEFGLLNGKIILIDEVLTPDSSRFWPMETYSPGGAQKSYDKQYLRDYLSSLDWNKQPPPPLLPEEIIQNTRKKYLEALLALTGNTYGIDP